MDDSKYGDLIAFLEGGLSNSEREVFIEKLLSDPESAKLAQLMSLPEFHVKNNLPLPFETPARFLAGCHEGFLIPLVIDHLEYGETTRGFLGEIARIFVSAPPKGVHRRLDLVFGDGDESALLKLILDSAREEREINLSIRTGGDIEGNIEIWEGGALILKTGCSSRSEQSVFSIEPGTAIAFRRCGSDVGARVLVSEVEFSTEDWKAAFISSCVEGRLSEALEILRKWLAPTIGAEGWIEKVGARLSALSTVTKLDGNLLLPVPLTRAPTVDREDRVAALEVVWRGILHRWPSAATVSNPWSVEGVEPASDSDLRHEPSELVNACLSVADGNPIPPHATVQDADVQEGWIALRGWSAMLSRDYKRAVETFRSSPPTADDPFSLGMSSRLAEHLMESANLDSSRMVPRHSSDTVWREVLSPLLG